MLFESLEQLGTMETNGNRLFFQKKIGQISFRPLLLGQPFTQGFNDFFRLRPAGNVEF